MVEFLNELGQRWGSISTTDNAWINKRINDQRIDTWGIKFYLFNKKTGDEMVLDQNVLQFGKVEKTTEPKRLHV